MAAKIFLIGLAGALGTLCRYGLTALIAPRFSEEHSFAATMVVNVLGCFLFGLVWALCEERELLRIDHRMIVLVGFMGAFTTFSTYIFENNQLFFKSSPGLALLNLSLQNLLGFGAMFLGLMLGGID